MAGKIECKIQEHIATVFLNNPAKRNAIDLAMWQALQETFLHLSKDESLRCVILRGTGGDFAAGGDIAQFPELRASLEECRNFHENIVGGALRAIDECLHPTVAMVRGNCIGGGLEIAAQCDLRIAAHSARFGAPVGKLGFNMAYTELASLVSRFGQNLMLEILLEGRLLGADEAYRKGLVTRVIPDDEIEDETLATARRIAAGAPLAARSHKKLVRRLAHGATALTAVEIAESFAFLNTEDYQIGLRAFIDKDIPEFKGR